MNIFYFISLALCLINTKCNENKIDESGDQKKKKFSLTNSIYVKSISYELSYNEFSIIKVTIKTYNIIDKVINFNAYLKSDSNNKYILNCQTFLNDNYIIECNSQKNITFNTHNHYSFYYKRNKDDKYTFNGKNIFEDNKSISLVFKPVVLRDQLIYKDNERTILVKTHGNMVRGGYLYLTRKQKKVLQKPKDGFNKYIELNNFISHCGLMGYRPQSTYAAFEEGIRRGYHIVDADLLFTKDKIPVICHGKNLKEVSNGIGEIPSKTLEELEKLDFGSIFNKKYKGEKILTFEKLLKLCKENNVIIDLDLFHNQDKSKYFNDNEYIKIIIDLIEKYDMLNSIFFNDRRLDVISKFNEYKKGLSFSINNMNEKKNIEEIKDKFKECKRIIYNMGGLTEGKKISEDVVKYGLSLGKKIKAAKVDNIDFANKIVSYGVNFITTNYLHPFMIKNDKEDPIIIRCLPSDENEDISKCEIKDNIKLKDNQIYNIYYSDNIYNISEDINNIPIGEFKYIDTNKFEKLYYEVIMIDFKKGIIKIKTSNKVIKGKKIMGVIGPSYDNVAECYKYDFTCIGNNSQILECSILKDNDDKVQYDGNYSILSLEGYSLNSNENTTIFLFCLIFFAFILVSILIIYYWTNLRNREQFSKMKISENSYIQDNK